MNFYKGFECKKRKGFTLVEAMVFLFIFSITVVTFYRTFSSGTQAIANVKSRLGATALANEKMEIIRNLDYEAIGTVDGAPVGNIPQEETVAKNGRTYYVHTLVKFVDDPFDGTLIAGTDTRWNDYKQIRVEVFWDNNNPAKSTTLISNIAPPGIESIYTGGILSINVLDSGSTGEVRGIGQADINISNPSKGINITSKTDDSGNFFWPGLPAADESYRITVSKAGYSPFTTVAPFPTTSYFPTIEYTHANLVEGNINQKTITTDKISTITLSTKDPFGNNVPNLEFELKGGKKIGDTNTEPSESLYSYSNLNLQTNESGQKILSDMIFGSYYFTFKDTLANSNHVFVHMDPSIDEVNEFNVVADTNTEVTAVVADKSVDSLFVTITDVLDSSPVADATVELRNDSLSYGPVTVQTNAYGQAFFPEQSTPLQKTDYDLSVSKSGYATQNKSISIDGLIVEAIELVQS